MVGCRRWLQRDFGIYVINMFDTGQAARVLQYPGLGLKYLLQHFCSVHVCPFTRIRSVQTGPQLFFGVTRFTRSGAKQVLCGCKRCTSAMNMALKACEYRLSVAVSGVGGARGVGWGGGAGQQAAPAGGLASAPPPSRAARLCPRRHPPPALHLRLSQGDSPHPPEPAGKHEGPECWLAKLNCPGM